MGISEIKTTDDELIEIKFVQFEVKTSSDSDDCDGEISTRTVRLRMRRLERESNNMVAATTIRVRDGFRIPMFGRDVCDGVKITGPDNNDVLIDI